MFEIGDTLSSTHSKFSSYPFMLATNLSSQEQWEEWECLSSFSPKPIVTLVGVDLHVDLLIKALLKHLPAQSKNNVLVG